MAYDFSKASNGITLYYTITSSTSPYTVEVVPQNSSYPYYSTNPTGDLVIPESVEYNSITYSVTSIDEKAFYECSELTSVTIPNSVSSIGYRAFLGCSGLTMVNYTGDIADWCGISFGGELANPLYYAHNLYVNNELVTDLVIPQNVMAINYSTFYGATCLTSVTIPNSVTSIGGYAFSSCSGLTSVTIPNLVTSIGEGSFYNCSGLTSVTIPNSVTSICDYAFSNCSGLTSVTIPNSVTRIGYSVFSGCSGLTSVTIPNSVSSIGYRAFLGCSGLTSVTIPNSVTSIGYSAFSDCSGLTSVTIPNSVTSIGRSAFSGCSGLTSVTIPFVGGSATATSASESTLFGYLFGTTSYTGGTAVEQKYGSGTSQKKTYYIPSNLRSVTVTGGNLLYGAFYGCSMLTSVTISNSVTSIGQSAFSGCSGLASVTIPNSVTSIGASAFYNCSGLTTVNFNATNCTTMGSSSYPVFQNCNANATINIGEGVTTIPDYAFKGLLGNGILTIPNSVTSIGLSAFYNCSRVTTVNFNATNCTTMGSLAYPVFGGCTSLATLNIGENVTNIPAYAFSGCSGLTSVTIPNSVTSIGDRAFYNCSGLTSVTVGSGVSNIGQDAFYNCSGLTMVVYTGSIAQWCGISFGNNSAQPLSYAHNLYINSSLVTNLVIPNTVEEIKAYAFYYANSLTSVTIPNSVTSIGDRAFYNCCGLTTVNFNATNCTTMGSSSYPVFQNCNANATINIGEGVTTIPDYAFKGLLGNGILIIPSSVTSIGNSAFSGCSGMTGALTIPNSVISIGGSAFYGCGGLSGTLTIPNSVASIGSQAFSGCNRLSILNFNAENCTGTISDYLFDNNNTLSKITIGENVTTIPNNTFQYCTALDSIISAAENPPVIYASTFEYSNISNIPVIVPCGTVETYVDADFWYNFRRIQQSSDCGTTYTITVVSANPSQGTVTGGGTYQAGTVATLTATANDGYRFLSWSDNSTENPHYITVTEDAMYIATFEVVNSQQPIYVTINETACGSYTWNDSSYTQSGEYQQTFTTSTSVDSIVTLVLEIFPLPEPEITATGVLDACNPSSVTLSTSNYSAYNWNTGESTETITITEPGNYFVEVVDGHGCHGYSEMLEVGYSNTLTEAPQLRRVGMSNTGTNIIQWTVANTEGIAGFEIYREDNIANVYTLIQRVDRPGVRSCTDVTANPSARAYRYKICAVDECGGLSPLSEPHKTMHLTINRGLGNTWNLIWSPYEGMEFASYKIYRGSTIQNMVVIGEVPSTMNTFTDSDNPACAGFFYKVVIVANTRSDDEDEMLLGSNIVDNGLMPEYTITAVSANPNQGTVVGGGTYPEGSLVTLAAIPADGYEFLSWSDESTDNPHYITVTGDAVYVATFVPSTDIKDNALPEIALFPNPAADILNITSSETISEIEIVNVMGQIVKRMEANCDTALCDVEDLKAGVYIVKISTASATLSIQKFAKE